MADGVSMGELFAVLALKDLLSPALAEAEKSVLRFAGKYASSVKAVGEFSALVGGAVVGLTTAIVELGSRGADVADIKAQFDALNAGIGNTGDVLGGLRTALSGTVSDFDIMRTVNEGLSLGMKLTADQMDLVGKTARVLADRTGGEVKDKFDELTLALGRGQDRLLKHAGIMSDASGAVDKFAFSIGREASQLSNTQQLEVSRTAMLQAMADAVKKTGEAHDDFADRVQQAKVSVSNFVDSLALAVSQSPVVNAAMDGISQGIKDAFGSNQQETIKTLMVFVNNFAIGLVTAGQVAVTVAQGVSMAWSGLKVVFASVFSGMMALVEGAQRGAALVAAGMSKIPGFGAQGAADTAASLRAAADESAHLRIAFDEQAKSTSFSTPLLDKMADALSGLHAKMTAAAGSADVMAHAHGGIKPPVEADVVAMRALQKAMEELDAKFATAAESAAKAARDFWEEIENLTRKLTGADVAEEAEKWALAWQDVSDKTKVSTQALDEMLHVLDEAIGAGNANEDVIRAQSEAWDEYASRVHVAVDLDEILRKQAQDAAADFDRLRGEVLALAQSLADLPANFSRATDSASGLRRLLGGAQLGSQVGGQIGHMFGGDIGEAIGSWWGMWIGGIAGLFHSPSWIRVGREAGRVLGQNVSEELARAIQQMADDRHISIAVASLLNLHRAIEESHRETSTFMPQIQALMRAIADGSAPAREGLEQLSQAWSDLQDEAKRAGAEFTAATVNMIRSARATGTLTEGMRSEIAAGVDQALQGAHMIEEGFAAAGAAIPELADEAATAFMAAWSLALQEGRIFDALTLLGGDEFETFLQQLADSGNEAAQAIIAPFAALRAMMQDPVFAGMAQILQGVTQELIGMGRAGFLDTQAFQAMMDLATGTFDAMLSGAEPTREQLLMIAPAIQAAIDAAAAFGVPLSEDMERLRELAEQNGISFRTDPMERLIDSINALVEALGGVPPALDDIAEHAARASRPVHIPVHIDWQTMESKLPLKSPPMQVSIPEGGIPFDMPNIPSFDVGGRVPWTPSGDMVARVHSGETITPPGQAGPGGAPIVNFEVNVHVAGNVASERDFVDNVKRSIREEIDAGASEIVRSLRERGAVFA